MKRSLRRVACLFTYASLIAGPVYAQQESARNRAAQVVEPDPDRARLTAPQEFGTADLAVKWIPMSAFQPRTGTATFNYHGDGYVSIAAGDTDFLWAPLDLPNGVLIDTVRAWILDNSLVDISLLLVELGGTSDGAVALGNVSSSGTGNTSISIFPNHILDNSNKMYAVYLGMPVDSDARVKGVRVLYRRQVSPAPGTATFGDIPTSHPFHRYVEALVAANITGGCGGGNYCPDAPVTRGQMAVFLAVALGLHHPF